MHRIPNEHYGDQLAEAFFELAYNPDLSRQVRHQLVGVEIAEPEVPETSNHEIFEVPGRYTYSSPLTQKLPLVRIDPVSSSTARP